MTTTDARLLAAQEALRIARQGLEKIAAQSAAPDDWQPRDAYNEPNDWYWRDKEGRLQTTGVDTSNSGDIADHAVAAADFYTAKIAREILAAISALTAPVEAAAQPPAPMSDGGRLSKLEDLIYRLCDPEQMTEEEAEIARPIYQRHWSQGSSGTEGEEAQP